MLIITQAKKNDCLSFRRQLSLNDAPEMGDAMVFHTALSLADPRARAPTLCPISFKIRAVFERNWPKQKGNPGSATGYHDVFSQM